MASRWSSEPTVRKLNIVLEVALVLVTAITAVRFWKTRAEFDFVVALVSTGLAGLALLTTHRLNVLQSPRALTPRDVERLCQQLRGLPPVFVEITSPAGDAEACAFADQLAHILDALDWSAGRSQQLGARRFPHHIEIIVHDVAQAPVQARPLLAAIQNLGFTTSSPLRENPNSPYSFELAIGHK